MSEDLKLINKTAMKEYIKAKGLMTQGDLDKALTDMLLVQLDKITQRTVANGRKTVMVHDL